MMRSMTEEAPREKAPAEAIVMSSWSRRVVSLFLLRLNRRGMVVSVIDLRRMVSLERGGVPSANSNRRSEEAVGSVG